MSSLSKNIVSSSRARSRAWDDFERKTYELDAFAKSVVKSINDLTRFSWEDEYELNDRQEEVSRVFNECHILWRFWVQSRRVFSLPSVKAFVHELLLDVDCDNWYARQSKTPKSAATICPLVHSSGLRLDWEVIVAVANGTSVNGYHIENADMTNLHPNWVGKWDWRGCPILDGNEADLTKQVVCPGERNLSTHSAPSTGSVQKHVDLIRRPRRSSSEDDAAPVRALDYMGGPFHLKSGRGRGKGDISSDPEVVLRGMFDCYADTSLNNAWLHSVGSYFVCWFCLTILQ